MDFLSIVGVILAFAAIIGGNWLEGGHATGLLNGPAGLIVIGGTLAAIMIQTSFATFRRGFAMIRWVFMPPVVNTKDGVEKVISWSMRARKEGLLGLEAMAEKEAEPFARKALQLLVDGVEPQQIRDILEVDLMTQEERDMTACKIYEAMGGYAPTIGIIGAVMGLIHVMSNLADPSTLGSGIATAFVATIYGVAFANLLLFPVGARLKEIVREQAQYREMLIEGVVSISEGENPRAIELRLKGFLH